MSAADVAAVAATNCRRDIFRDIYSLSADPFAVLFSVPSLHQHRAERARNLAFKLIALPAAAHYYPSV
jgi:hypothetical protein